ncbi:MAG: SDR family oxidoreductase [Leptolyngbyaceae cyanobacterium]
MKVLAAGVLNMSGKRTLLITGASSGIGAATARQAVAQNFQLALAARSMDKLEQLTQELGSDNVRAFTCDVTDYASQEKLVDDVIKAFGRLDAVFANAGTGGEAGGFSGAPVESWQKIVNTNILGVAYTLRASLEAIKKAQGHVVITGSIAGRKVLSGSMYSASKWAVSAIGYNLREEMRGTGVRVTLIEPGMVDTPFFDDPKPDALRPDDVARTVLFALSQPPGVDITELVVMPTPPTE